MGRLGRMTALAGWVLALAALLAGLLAVGDGALAGPSLGDPGSWSEWLAARPGPDAAMAVLRLVGVALCAYLLVVTVVAVALRVGDAGRLVSVADVVTLPIVRAVVQAGLGVGLAGATVAAVGAGTGPARAPTAAEVALVSADAVSTAATPPVLEPVDQAPPVLQKVAADPPPASSQATWTVAPGDHLWSIAERVLLDAWGRPPTDAEVVPFWASVIDTNRAGLADPSNPDLLFPGQVLDVPTPPPAP